MKTMSKTSPRLAEESLAAERRAFESQRARLMRRYPGEYVALSGGRVVDHDKQDEGTRSPNVPEVRRCGLLHCPARAKPHGLRSPVAGIGGLTVPAFDRSFTPPAPVDGVRP